MQITQWGAGIGRHPIDFSYTSMESDEAGLVCIRKRQDRWKVSAFHQDYSEDRLFSLEEIENAIATFVARLTTEVQERFQHNISHLVSGRPIAL